MNAKLVYPDGQVQELTDAELEQVQKLLDRSARKEHLKKTLQAIKNDPDKKPKEWWDALDRFIEEHPLNFSG